ncbi:hypothetical protein SAPIO_CDS0003 [Scedosporium apiospermum]|uniref:Uncharacterized protein n=1 Tax=Pseudallescheria apiosperma TaxID=563466 RepID=A0A084GHB6_PSEDA|nr:uncharacterized protein SAPIO_CDS0003 [Scedosporium apiospermum]KEZ46728.1 hypothetical protein SAPIO_CDS0003 [Scedosporium apiospermum]
MVLSAVPLTDTAATGTLSVATLVEEALEQCKAEMAQPSDKFDILSCTAQQRWLVSKAVEAFQTLKWRKSPASLREWSWRNLAGIHRTSDGDLPWFSADIIALNEYGTHNKRRFELRTTDDLVPFSTELQHMRHFLGFRVADLCAFMAAILPAPGEQLTETRLISAPPTISVWGSWRTNSKVWSSVVAFSDEVAASTYADQLHTLLADRYAATIGKLGHHWVEGCYYAYLLSLNDARMHLL